MRARNLWYKGWEVMFFPPHSNSSREWFSVWLGLCSHDTRVKLQIKLLKYDLVFLAPIGDKFATMMKGAWNG